MNNTFIKVPFMVQKNAQEMYYKGKTVKNYDEVHCIGDFIKKGDTVYLLDPIQDVESDILPNPMKDIVIGKVFSIETVGEELRLVIEVNDTLNTSKISDPVVRISGLMYEDPDDPKCNTMTKVTKITFGPRVIENLYLL